MAIKDFFLAVMFSLGVGYFLWMVGIEPVRASESDCQAQMTDPLSLDEREQLQSRRVRVQVYLNPPVASEEGPLEVVGGRQDLEVFEQVRAAVRSALVTRRKAINASGTLGISISRKLFLHPRQAQSSRSRSDAQESGGDQRLVIEDHYYEVAGSVREIELFFDQAITTLSTGRMIFKFPPKIIPEAGLVSLSGNYFSVSSD